MSSSDESNNTPSGTPVGRMEPQLKIVGRNPLRSSGAEIIDLPGNAPPDGGEHGEAEGSEDMSPEEAASTKATVLMSLAYSIFLNVMTPEQIEAQLKRDGWDGKDIQTYLGEIKAYLIPLNDYVDQLVAEESGAGGGQARTAADLLDRVGERVVKMLQETPALAGMDLSIHFVNTTNRGVAGLDIRVNVGLTREGGGWERDIPNFAARATRTHDKLGVLIDAVLEEAVGKLNG